MQVTVQLNVYGVYEVGYLEEDGNWVGVSFATTQEQANELVSKLDELNVQND